MFMVCLLITDAALIKASAAHPRPTVWCVYKLKPNAFGLYREFYAAFATSVGNDLAAHRF